MTLQYLRQQTPATTTANRKEASLPCLSSQQLFAGQREVLIEHGDQLYHLRITRQNKLLLTK